MLKKGVVQVEPGKDRGTWGNLEGGFRACETENPPCTENRERGREGGAPEPDRATNKSDHMRERAGGWVRAGGSRAAIAHHLAGRNHLPISNGRESCLQSFERRSSRGQTW